MNEKGAGNFSCQVVQQEALARLLEERGVFSKKELLEMVKVVEMKKRNVRESNVWKSVQKIFKK
jgi:hypothetical protein